MTRERLRTQAERQVLAALGGQAWKLARWGELTPEETAEAVAALREIAAGRTDILAMATGIAEAHAEDYDRAGDKHRAAAEWRCAVLYRAAGADPDLIPEWIAEGRRRAARDRVALERGNRRFAARVASVARQLADDRPEADRVLAARLAQEAAARVSWDDATEAEEGAAITTLRILAVDRADLLAEVARTFGRSYGCSDEHLARSAARLCYRAAADLAWRLRPGTQSE